MEGQTMTTKIKLSSKQKQQLLKTKKKHKSVLVRDRAQAVLARGEGLTIHHIAKALLRSDDFVKRAIIKFKKGKLEVVNLTSNNCKLSNKQRKEIVQMIHDQCPKDLVGFKFKTQFWSTDILKEILKTKYHIEYKTHNSYNNLFKQAGFTFHKPKPKDFRQDPEKIKAWKGALKKSYKTTKIRLSW